MYNHWTTPRQLAEERERRIADHLEACAARGAKWRINPGLVSFAVFFLAYAGIQMVLWGLVEVGGAIGIVLALAGALLVPIALALARRIGNEEETRQGVFEAILAVITGLGSRLADRIHGGDPPWQYTLGLAVLAGILAAGLWELVSRLRRARGQAHGGT